MIKRRLQMHAPLQIAAVGSGCLLLQWCSLVLQGTERTFLQVVGLGLEIPFWLFGVAGLALLELMNLALLGGRLSIDLPPSPWLSAWVGVPLWKIAVVNTGQLLGSIGVYWAASRLAQERLTTNARTKIALILCAASVWTWLYWLSRVHHIGEYVVTASLLAQGRILSLGGRSLPESLLTSDQDYGRFYIDSVLLTLLSSVTIYSASVLVRVLTNRWRKRKAKPDSPSVVRAV